MNIPASIFFALCSDTNWRQNGCTTSTGELAGTCPTSVDWCSSAARWLARWQLVKSQRPTCTLPLTSSFIYESVTPGKGKGRE